MSDGRKTAWTEERKRAHAEKVKVAWEKRREEGKKRKPASAETKKKIAKSWTKERRKAHSERMSKKWDDDNWRDSHEIEITGQRSIKLPPFPFDVSKIEGFDLNAPHTMPDIRLFLSLEQQILLDEWQAKCDELTGGKYKLSFPRAG